ncbi:MAG TPA: MBL fold metallo-hydrolase [Blastocatellia bacterium]|nr:MBL fold metallo-hydrolase [Blastocatellia bacterium]
MKLTILGSGTVGPSGSRNSAGYFVELLDAQIMMDCGAGTVHAFARFGLPWEQMTHLFISHFHVDHIGELASLLSAFSYGMKTDRSEPFTIIGPLGLDRVIDGLKTAFGSRLFEPRFPVSVRMVTPGERLELGSDSTLTVAKTPHTQESLAVRIESRGRVLCYTGDTDYSEQLAGFFTKADVLISECSLREPREGVRHLSVRQAARLAAKAEVAKLIVTHFYFEVDETELKAELEREYSGDVIIGRDGLVIDVA